ncbi:MAG: hypothetical protein GDA48_21990 [Hormoscilla sp. GM102CHS1]|nr:hypothetical protein [Hormoscilla sp. GM102CHS1]
MGIRVKKVITAWMLGIAGAATIASAAQAQSANTQPVIISPAQAFNRAMFSNSGTYFKNRSLWRQANSILGIGGFPENRLTRDAKLVNLVYRDVLRQQVSSTPIIRIRDLRNPFDSTVGNPVTRVECAARTLRERATQ